MAWRTRFPDLRIMPVENGSAWVRPLVDKFQKVYSRVPKAFDEDPMEAFKRCIYVHPFHEEDPIGLVKLIGADNVLFGSDFPHPEGMYDPIGFVDQLDGLAEDEKAKVMGGNLNRIMKVPALVERALDGVPASGGAERVQAVDALDGQRGDLVHAAPASPPDFTNRFMSSTGRGCLLVADEAVEPLEVGRHRA